ncbi:hypothetical protein LPB142_07415 [Rhodobacter xanthinilyticus]|uniref:histidine kinase n=1 Tax=Rhodobacter xanthinilyticus TaxID=1850250 RepID=A0A1D9MBG8_9RHOB|nr:hypothetical protein LPB142_07415 [Rhodobacter xanthinilyticus]
MPAGIAHIDREMRFLYANRRFAAAYGKRPGEVIGVSAGALLHPRTMAQSSRYFEQARRGAQVDFEMRIELPGGRVKEIRTLLRPETLTAPEAGAPGEVIGFYLLSIDVTRRKATTGALMRAQKMDALGRMASGISHDFNNLLTVLLGNLLPLSDELATREGLAPLNAEYLAPAISAARRGAALTSRLLTLARREQYAPEPTDIAEAVAEICALLRSSLPRGLDLLEESAAGLPQALVDRAGLEMALLNLVLNARDATGGTGAIRVTLDCHSLPPGEAELLYLPAGRYLRLRVADDGCGMSAEQVERIFEPFFTSKAAGGGSGLGLSMVYGFVKQSNGAIHVESAPGQGAVFSILLPEVEGAGAAPTPAAPPAAVPAARPLVLLVEDDRELRRSLRRRIAALGYPILEAETGAEAQALAVRVGSVGIVLSDIDLGAAPDGLALARHLRATRPGIGLALMSGRGDLLARAALDLPGVALLAKPFDEAELVQTLRAAQAQAPKGAR